MEYREFIYNVLTESSKIALKHFGKVKGWAKNGNNRTVLTEADLEIADYIIASIKKKYPNHNIIDEEKGVINNNSKYTWVIDPIDGTSNFAAGSPNYGIMIGLLENDTPLAGGFALPSFSEIYLAEKGKGATCNGKQIHVTDEINLEKCLIAVGFGAKTPEKAEMLGNFIKILVLKILNVRASASTFDMAMVAKGSYGAFISTSGKIWDCVGPHILIEEAGGKFTHCDGSEIDYSNPTEKRGIQFDYFMASPHVHEELMKIIRSNKIT